MAVGWVYFGANYWIFTVSYAVIVAIAALGLMVVVGWGREISLAHGALVGTALYLFGFFYRAGPAGWGWPFLAAAVAATVVVTSLMALVSLASLKLPGVYVLVLTLGLQFMLESIVFPNPRFAGGLTALQTPLPGIPGLDLDSDRAFYFFPLGWLAVVLLVLARLRFSRYGRALLLVGTSRQAAAAVGISPWRYKLFAFVVSGVFAGVAGVLSALLFRSPPGTQNYMAFASLFLLAIPVLAGFDSLFAVVLVAVAFGLAPQSLVRFRIDPLLLAGCGLVAGILLGSRGLGGRAKDLYSWLRHQTLRSRREAHRLAVGGAGGSADERRALALAVVERYLARSPGGDVALKVSEVSVTFGGCGRSGASHSPSPPGRSSGSSAPTAPGRPRCST